MSITSSKLIALIKIQLNNASETPYTNTDYGIVNDVMYLTDSSDVVNYDSNNYYTDRIPVNGIGTVSNKCDMTKLGGYDSFNEFTFSIVDDGLLSALKTLSISLERCVVEFTIVTSSGALTSYVGCIDNKSSTGRIVKIICEDIGLVYENKAIENGIIGEFGKQYDEFISTKPSIKIVGDELSDSKYCKIFVGTTSTPDDYTYTSYQQNKNAFETLARTDGVLDVDRFSFQIYAEREDYIIFNSSFGSISVYESYLKEFAIELVDGDSASQLFHILNISRVVDDLYKITVYGDTSNITANKTKIRFVKPSTKSRVKYTGQEFEYESDLYNSKSTANNGVVDTESSLLDGGIGSDTYSLSMSNTDSKIPLTVYDNVPSLVVGVIPSDDNWGFARSPDNKTNTNAELNDGCGSSDWQFALFPDGVGANSSQIEVRCAIHRDDLPSGDLKVGFSILLYNENNLRCTLDSTEGIQVSAFGYNDRPISDSGYTKPPNIFDVDLDDPYSYTYYNQPTNENEYIWFGSTPAVNSFDLIQNAIPSNVTSVITNIKTEANDMVLNKNEIIEGDYIYLRFTFSIDCTLVTAGDRILGKFGSLVFYEEGEPSLSDVSFTHLKSTNTGESSNVSEVAKYLFSEYTDHQIPSNIPIVSPKVFLNTKSSNDFKSTVNELLDGTSLLITSDNLGNRLFIDLFDLINLDEADVVRVQVGSTTKVKQNSSFNSINNLINFEAGGGYVDPYSIVATIDKDTGILLLNGAARAFPSDPLYNLYNLINTSISFNNSSNTFSVKQLFNNTADESNLTTILSDVERVIQLLGYSKNKWTYSVTIDEFRNAPISIGNVISFRDLVYTNDVAILGKVCGVSINYKSNRVEITSIGESQRPLASYLDEQPLQTALIDENSTGGAYVNEAEA